MLCAIHRRSEAGEGRNQLVFYCSSREKPALGLEKQRGDEDIYIVIQAGYLVLWQVPGCGGHGGICLSLGLRKSYEWVDGGQVSMVYGIHRKHGQ